MTVDRMLVRCEAESTPAVERHLTGADDDPESWLVSATGLLRASWSEGRGRDCAVAAVAVLEYALDMGDREHPQRPRWVLHLWLAERTLARRFEDHRLSDEVQHHLAAQTQGRSADDPVAVAANYLEEPPPRHFEPPRRSHPDAVRLADGLPADDLVRPCLLARLAQSAYLRLESGDATALEDAGRWADAAFTGITADHPEAAFVSRTAVHTALTRFRDRPSDVRSVRLGLRAGRSALRAVEHSRRYGTGSVDADADAASAHLMLSLALTAFLPFDPDEELVDEAIAQLQAFQTCAPPDDNGMGLLPPGAGFLLPAERLVGVPEVAQGVGFAVAVAQGPVEVQGDLVVADRGGGPAEPPVRRGPYRSGCPPGRRGDRAPCRARGPGARGPGRRGALPAAPTAGPRR